MVAQLSHKETNFYANIPKIIVVCDGLQSPANVGSLFRVCDALGIHQILFCGTTVDLRSSRLKRTARNTENNTPYKDGLDITTVLASFLDDSHTLVALEITSQSIPLEAFRVNKTKITVLIIGNEKNGVTEEALHFAEKSLHIEMLGKNSSMNVVNAAAIALFTLTKL